MLRADLTAPREQRHTIQRVFECLVRKLDVEYSALQAIHPTRPIPR
jgi:hypothetical protein